MSPKRSLWLRLWERELARLMRNRLPLAMLLLGPLLLGGLLGWAYIDATPRDLPIAVLDQDDSPLSHLLADALDEHENLQVVRQLGAPQQLREALVSQGLEAVVLIPAGFEAQVQQKRTPAVQVVLNGSNMIPANFVDFAIRSTLGTYNAGMQIAALQKQGTPPSLAARQWHAFDVQAVRYLNSSKNYLRFFWPGILAAAFQMMLLLCMALPFSQEVASGSLLQLRALTPSAWKIYAVKTLPLWLLGMLVWGVCQGLLFPLLGVPAPAHWAPMLVLLMLFVAAVVALGAFMSALVPWPLKATNFLMVLASPSLIVSGFSWPQQGMPLGVRLLADTVPLTHFLQGVRTLISWPGSGWAQLWPQLQVLALLTLVYGALGMAVWQWRYRRYRHGKPARVDNLL